jgi:TRAP-type uncharacterized transport system fused permease subunit
VPLEPLHRPRFRRDPGRPPRPDRFAAAIRAARTGAVLAAIVAVGVLFLGPGALPFDAQYLIVAAFLAPILIALVRPPR